MECIQNSATNDYKLKCSHTTLCLSIDGCSHTYNMYYLGGSQKPTQIKWIIKCVEFCMDGHFNDKPSYVISGDGCHLPPKTLFPSFKQNLIFEYTQCDETHCQFHFSLYCLASSSTRIKWEIQMVSTILVRRLFYLYLSHTNRPFNRH